MGWSDSISLTRRIFTWSPASKLQRMSAFSLPVSRSISFHRMVAGVVVVLTSGMRSSHSMPSAIASASSW